MPRFAANVSLMYPEYPLLARIGAAARDGFAAVEVQAPYEVAAAEFRRALADARCEAVLMNAPVGGVGGVDGGELGLAALPGREREFDAAAAQALDYACTIGAPRVHVLAGAPPPQVAHDEALAAYRRNIRQAAALFARHGVTAMIEPLNRRDMPGYFLHALPLAVDVIESTPSPAPRLQFDFYHLQIIGGDLLRSLRASFAHIGHVQIAGVPQRNEPDTGELNYAVLLRELDRLGYAGWVGCEYRPARAGPHATSAGLGWLRRL